MARMTIYCAQGYWWRNGRLERGAIHHFLSAERAQQGGDILALSADAVAVFSMSGEPDVDFWEDPVIIARHGDVPAEAA